MSTAPMVSTSTDTAENVVVSIISSESKLRVTINISAVALTAALLAILLSVLVLALQLKKQCHKLKPKSGKNELPTMEFTNPVYTSPVYNPSQSEEKDDM